MRRYSRIDASSCSFLAVCGACAGWRDGPWSTQVLADAALLRHLVAEHPTAGNRRRQRAAA